MEMTSHFTGPQMALETLENRWDKLRERLKTKDLCVAVSLEEGILLMAADQLGRRQYKVYQVYDRIALVGNMEPDLNNLADILINQADMHGYMFSPGDVSINDTVRLAEQVLIYWFRNVYAHSKNIEIITAEVTPSFEHDSVVYVPFSGSRRYAFGGDQSVSETKRYVLIGGQAKSEESDEEQEDLTSFDLAKDYLSENYAKEMSFKEMVTNLYPFFKTIGNGTQVAVLDREMAEKRKFKKVFQRINLADWGIES